MRSKAGHRVQVHTTTVQQTLGECGPLFPSESSGRRQQIDSQVTNDRQAVMNDNQAVMRDSQAVMHDSQANVVSSVYQYGALAAVSVSGFWIGFVVVFFECVKRPCARSAPARWSNGVMVRAAVRVTDGQSRAER